MNTKQIGISKFPPFPLCLFVTLLYIFLHYIRLFDTNQSIFVEFEKFFSYFSLKFAFNPSVLVYILTNTRFIPSMLHILQAFPE